ncbi:MAG: hypothetical protein L3K26_04535 [Candidatus Hydrogenedentes bacterium]|nr:hypothetical protein [Candidatus Hydrogenedentota bacterium]
MLFGFILSKRIPGGSFQVEPGHVEKVHESVDRWQATRRAGAPTASSAPRRQSQGLVEEIVLKVRLRRFERLGAAEIELARGTLEGLYACKCRGPLVTHLESALKHYERSAANAQGQAAPVPAELVARRNLLVFGALAFSLFVVAYQIYDVEENEIAAAKVVSPSADSLGVSTRTRPHRLSPEDRLARRIEEYEEKLDEDPESAEAPALRFALGNLNAQKRRDYVEAARHYELLLYDYPEWPNMRQVFVQLEHCYEKTEDEPKREELFREMKRRFPEGSREYRYANSQLGY